MAAQVRDGKGFVNIGFLMGCAFEFDSRAAISADLDSDGAVDLLVEHKDLRGKSVRMTAAPEKVQIFHNGHSLYYR